MTKKPFRSWSIERDASGTPERMVWQGDRQATPVVCTFVIHGRCPTKGSTKSFAHPKTGRIVTMADNKSLRRWTTDAKWKARVARVPMIYKPHGVTIDVLVEFLKPKTSKATAPTVRPDADKLLRAILDALTGIAYADDSQVVQAAIMKVYGPCERVTVTIGKAVV